MQRLEARTTPAADPMVIELRFVSPDKVATGTLLIEMAPLPHTLQRAAKRGGGNSY